MDGEEEGGVRLSGGGARGSLVLCCAGELVLVLIPFELCFASFVSHRRIQPRRTRLPTGMHPLFIEITIRPEACKKHVLITCPSSL
jgi:hypothetical protein